MPRNLIEPRTAMFEMGTRESRNTKGHLSCIRSVLFHIISAQRAESAWNEICSIGCHHLQEYGGFQSFQPERRGAKHLRVKTQREL